MIAAALDERPDMVAGQIPNVKLSPQYRQVLQSRRNSDAFDSGGT
jgi:hypothetical protein